MVQPAARHSTTKKKNKNRAQSERKTVCEKKEEEVPLDASVRVNLGLNSHIQCLSFSLGVL